MFLALLTSRLLRRESTTGTLCKVTGSVLQMLRPAPSSEASTTTSSSVLRQLSGDACPARQYLRTFRMVSITPGCQHTVATYQSSGCFLMNSFINASHSAFWRLTTSMPRCRR